MAFLKLALGILISLLIVAPINCAPHASNFTNEPGCDILPENNLLTCYLIDSNSLDVVYEAMDETTNWTEVAMAITSADANAFPEDIFHDLKLTKLIFSVNSTLDKVPTAIFQHIPSPLNYLEFTNVVGITLIEDTDFAQLPFSDDLQQLILQIPKLSLIEGSSFQTLNDLKALTIANTDIQYLPTDTLHGLTLLDELTITYNPITTIPKNFFIEQNLLRKIWLGANNLNFIEDGALNGLDTLQMISVAGNPFHCNCSLQWFKDWLTERDLLDASGATCSYPIEGPFSSIEFCT